MGLHSILRHLPDLRIFFFFKLFFFYFFFHFKMAAAPGKKQEQLTQTKKYAAWMASGDLYALPASAVPGCGFLLGMLLKREGITRASELYDVYAKQKSSFPKYLSCKFGAWNAIYANTVVKAFKDWEEAHVPKKEKKVKTKKEAPEKKKGPPRKVGPGSKKWDAFLARKDLKTTSVKLVPGVASILGEELCKRGYKTAAQLMDQYKGNKKGQCNSNDEAFKKWVLCCFGYWNTQYSQAVLAALKAADAVGISGTKGEANDNQGETFGQMVGRVAEETAEKVGDALDKASAEGGSADAGSAEANDNQGETFGDFVTRLAENSADTISDALEAGSAQDGSAPDGSAPDGSAEIDGNNNNGESDDDEAEEDQAEENGNAVEAEEIESTLETQESLENQESHEAQERLEARESFEQ